MIFIPVVLAFLMFMFIVLFVLSAAIYGLFIGMRDQLAENRKRCKKCKNQRVVEEDGVLVVCDSCLAQ